MTKLANFLQKTILVSIPGLDGSGHIRPYKLVDLEPCGLWLESDSFGEALIGREMGRGSPGPLIAFVPFTQVACVVGEAPPALQAVAIAAATHPSGDEGGAANTSGRAKPGAQSSRRARNRATAK